MKIEVNLERKYFFGILIAMLVLAGAIVTYAYNPSLMGGNPAVAGHSLDEIAAPTCTSSQALTHNATDWYCINIPFSGVSKIQNGSGIIVNPAVGTGVGTISATGRVVGGGRVFTKNNNCGDIWGKAYCLNSGDVLGCSEGTPRMTGFDGDEDTTFGSRDPANYYICVA